MCITRKTIRKVVKRPLTREGQADSTEDYVEEPEDTAGETHVVRRFHGFGRCLKHVIFVLSYTITFTHALHVEHRFINKIRRAMWFERSV